MPFVNIKITREGATKEQKAELFAEQRNSWWTCSEKTRAPP